MKTECKPTNSIQKLRTGKIPITTNADTSFTDVMMFVGFNNRMTEVHWLHQSALHKTCTVHTYVHTSVVCDEVIYFFLSTGRVLERLMAVYKLKNVWNEDS